MGNAVVSQSASSAGSNKKGITMRKIISSVKTSLDGYIEGPDGALDWLVGDMDEAAVADDAELLRSTDTVLLGRVSYDGFSQYWPSATDAFADLMNLPPKIVFSRSASVGGAQATPRKDVAASSYVRWPAAPSRVRRQRSAVSGQPLQLRSSYVSFY